VQWNNYVRNTSTGLVAYLNSLSSGQYFVAGVLDPALMIERNADGSPLSLINGQQASGTGGCWPTNGTANYPTLDGIHPSSAIVSLISPVVTASLFPLF
jgi:hypothetical protein